MSKLEKQFKNNIELQLINNKTKLSLWEKLKLQSKTWKQLKYISNEIFENWLEQLTDKDLKELEYRLYKKWLKFTLFSNLGKKANFQSAKDLINNIEYLNQEVFEYVDWKFKYNTSFNKRFSWLLTNTLMHAWVLHAGHTTLEESAHQYSAESYWWNTKIGISDPKTLEAYEWKWDISMYDLFIESFLNTWRWVTYWWSDDPKDYNSEKDAHIMWAWINSHTDYSKNFIKDTIKRWYTHATDISYFSAKLYGSIYYYRGLNWKDPHGDPASYIKDLKEQWIDVNVEELFKYSILSVLLSGWTLNTINASVGYLKNSEYSQENLWFHMWDYFISLPEFSTYLRKNWFSWSIDIVTKNKKTGTWYYFWLEHNIKWNVPTEFTLWTFGTYKKFTYDIWAKVNTKWWKKVEWKVTHLITENLWVSLEWSYSNWKNNDGYWHKQYNIMGWITFKF